MIHRFVDLLEEELEPAYSIIWNIRRVISGSTRTFAMAGGTPPSPPLARYLQQPPLVSLTQDYPELSPDLTEYVFIEVPSTTVRYDIHVASTDDVTTPTVVAQSPSGTPVGANGGLQILGWSPDSAKIYYRGVNNTTARDSEIREVNRDGTGNNLIWSSTAIDGIMWGVLPRISPDGTMFAWWLDFDASPNDGLYTMNSDGSGGESRIFASAGGDGEFHGWSRDSEWLIYQDRVFGVGSTTYKIRPDGSDQTTLHFASHPSTLRAKLGVGQESIWLPDSSGVCCSIDDGTGDREVGILLADGSGTFTPFSPQRLITVADTGVWALCGPVYSYDRFYWLEGNNSTDTSKVVSTLTDGTDYRVDDDMTDSSTVQQHDDYIFNGFAKTAS